MAQPVRILFLPEGVSRVTEAFRTVEQAAKRSQSSVTANLGKQRSAAQATAQAVVQSSEKAERQRTATADREATKRAKRAKSEADEVAKAVQRAEAETSRAMFREWQKRQADAKRAADKMARDRAAAEKMRGGTGVEGLSKKEAVSMLFGSSSAGMMSLGGTGMAIGGALALKGAISLAASALTQFGGFVINEVLRPMLAAKRGAQQMANRGAGSAAGILADARALNIAHGGGVDRAQAALGAAFETTRDYGMAKEVAGMSLTASRAYGVDDVESLTKHMATMRAQMRDVSPESFQAFMSAMIGQSKTGGLSLATQASLGGTTTDIARSFTGGSGGQLQRNIAGVQGIIGLSARETGDAQKSAAGLASLVDLAKSMRVGLDKEGRIRDVNALIPTMIAKLGGNAAAMHARGVSAETIDFLRPFMDMQKKGGVGLLGTIAAAGTDAKAAAGVAGKDEKSVAQTTEERFAAAVEHMKEKLVTLLPALENVMTAFADNAPAFSALINNAVIPLGVALGDLVAFTINNLDPTIQLLAGLLEILGAAVRIALVPITILPGIVAKAIAALLALVPEKLRTQGMSDFISGAEKYGNVMMGSGSIDMMASGADKIARGMANLKVDTGASAVTNPFTSAMTKPAAQVSSAGAALPGSLGWSYQPPAAAAAGAGTPTTVTLDPKSVNAITSALSGKTTASNGARWTPQSDPFRMSL